ncbi:MAG: aldo/keto reductase [Candidatus Poribacteria bacterium]
MSNEYNVPRRRWGKSELSISVIPFGTQGFGNHFGPVSDDEACELIRHSVDIGINHFDTALCYGDSQRKLGVALKRAVVKREEIIITARICCHVTYDWSGLDYTMNRGDVNYSADYAVANIEKQLELVGTDYFDAMSIHDPREIDPTLAENGTFNALKTLKARGVVKNIGYAMRPHHFHSKAIETGELDVLLTFNDYNLFGQTAADSVLPAAAEHDIGVLNGWSIKRGLLTGIDLAGHDQSNTEVQRATKMRQWCIDNNVNLLQLALHFCLRESRIHGNPIGSLNREQLEMNAQAVSEPLPEETLDRFLGQQF